MSKKVTKSKKPEVVQEVQEVVVKPEFTAARVVETDYNDLLETFDLMRKNMMSANNGRVDFTHNIKTLDRWTQSVCKTLKNLPRKIERAENAMLRDSRKEDREADKKARKLARIQKLQAALEKLQKEAE